MRKFFNSSRAACGEETQLKVSTEHDYKLDCGTTPNAVYEFTPQLSQQQSAERNETKIALRVEMREKWGKAGLAAL